MPYHAMLLRIKARPYSVKDTQTDTTYNTRTDKIIISPGQKSVFVYVDSSNGKDSTAYQMVMYS